MSADRFGAVHRTAAPDDDATAPATDPLRVYLREIAALTLLTREQEIALAKRVEEGEQRIVRAIVATAAGVAEVERINAMRVVPEKIKPKNDKNQRAPHLVVDRLRIGVF